MHGKIWYTATIRKKNFSKIRTFCIYFIFKQGKLSHFFFFHFVSVLLDIYLLCACMYVCTCVLIAELIITSGGENVAPVPIENKIKSEVPFLSNVMIIGDKKKFLSCLVTLKVRRERPGCVMCG